MRKDFVLMLFLNWFSQYFWLLIESPSKKSVDNLFSTEIFYSCWPCNADLWMFTRIKERHTSWQYCINVEKQITKEKANFESSKESQVQGLDWQWVKKAVFAQRMSFRKPTEKNKKQRQLKKIMKNLWKSLKTLSLRLPEAFVECCVWCVNQSSFHIQSQGVPHFHPEVAGISSNNTCDCRERRRMDVCLP